ncbi:hypothetical protein TNCV_2453621 [Trichonephila clavipes]|nr:hypothetical protein TNCV_2453621 [Trichonephila clavipes]
MRKRKILEIAHESVFGAHLGAHKTIQRIKFSFYSPGMVKEIKAYCSSCHGCQLRKVIHSVDKIPITPVSRPELPFQVVNVDLNGPVDPVSSQGHKYILCLMDQHSRWPEAIPLKSLTAKITCEAILEIFSRTGIPEVIVMDNATNFTASLTQEFLKILGACPRFSTPYHPEGNGISRELFEKAKRKVKVATHKAKLTSDVQQGSYAKYYSRQKKHREFAPGDQVLVLIPDSTNTLYARWTGPVKVVKRVKPNSYYLQMAGVPAAEKIDEALNIVTLDYLSKKQQTQLKDLLHRHRTLFSGKIKRAKVVEHVIKLKNEEETMKPKTYKIPENLKRKVDMQIDELLELGLIEPVVSEIAHPVVCVHKKDGTIRLCIDFRSLNALTVPDAYPMQNMMELNFLVGKKKFISVLHTLNGYWSIPSEDSSKHLTDFRTHRGQYQWNVLPFGLRNATATY